MLFLIHWLNSFIVWLDLNPAQMYVVEAFIWSYLLWAFFLIVMALKRARDEDKLTPVAKFFGYPFLFVGYAIDIFVNLVFMTVLLVELPRQFTVSSRIQLHIHDAGYRGTVARFIDDNFLKAYDPRGYHIKR